MAIPTRKAGPPDSVFVTNPPGEAIPVDDVGLPSNDIPGNLVYKFLGLSTDVSDHDMNVDGSTPKLFEYEVVAGRVFYLSRINFVIVDGAIQNGKFGGIAALSNGCLLHIIDSDNFTILLDFTDGDPIKTNPDFSPLAGVDAIITAAAGDDQLPIRFSIFKTGKYLRMTGGQKLRVTIQDDLRGITKFKTMVQGFYADS